MVLIQHSKITRHSNNGCYIIFFFTSLGTSSQRLSQYVFNDIYSVLTLFISKTAVFLCCDFSFLDGCKVFMVPFKELCTCDYRFFPTMRKTQIGGYLGCCVNEFHFSNKRNFMATSLMYIPVNF